MDDWVIKIGGSLYDSHYLAEWLDIINTCSTKNIVIVPGGGPFADQVRLADKKYHLNPLHAHNMAVLGMQQYGTLLASLCPKMELADDAAKIRLVWEASKIAIWEPYKMLSEECSLEKNWNVTSDSLAAWLASKLKLKNLLLIKSSPDVLQEQSVEKLSSSGCVDASFRDIVNQENIKSHFLHKSQSNMFLSLVK